MALIKCSECGRTISDKAANCVGCGAPLSPIAGFDISPKRDDRPPPTQRQLLWRGTLSLLALAGGAWWAHSSQRVGQENRIGSTLAALLVIAGLCGLIATVLQRLGARQQGSS